MKFSKLNKKKLLVPAVIIVVAATLAAIGFSNLGGRKASAAVTDSVADVTRGDIKVEISGSGVIQPAERYDITPLVKGSIISAPFEEGHQVKKGDILYRVDAAELEGNIQKTRNNISRLQLSEKSARENLDKTVVYAGTGGRLTNFTVKENESIGSNKLGEIVDDSYCLAKVAFSAAQVEKIWMGQPAIVTSLTHLTTFNGVVSKIGNFPRPQASGGILYDVEITITDRNTLVKDASVQAKIGEVESLDIGKIDMPEAYSVTSALSGRVSRVYVSNNDYVAKGQKLFELDSEAYASTLSRSALELSDANITLDSQQKQLEDYNMVSPIDGVVIKKNYKEGDTVPAASNSVTLMVVADTSKVKFDMKIDELDIAKIKVGQRVNVTADALPEKIFNGEITSIAGEGTAVNGVSNYLVQVTINQPGELKPGMNVNAKTLVAQKDNTLLVPAAAVQKKDGKSFVILPRDGKGNQEKVNVQIGINNKDYIEITGGLNEGDVIAVPSTAEEAPKASKSGIVGSKSPGGIGALPR